MSGRSEKILAVLGISLNRKEQNTSQESPNPNSPKNGNDENSYTELEATEEGVKDGNNENNKNDNTMNSDDSSSSSDDSSSSSDDSSNNSDDSSSDSICSRSSRCSRRLSATRSSTSPLDDSDRDPTFVNEIHESDESIYSDENDQKTRKRKRNPTTWKRNISKKLRRNSGKEYRSLHNGQLIPAKKILPPCKNTCKLKCTMKFTQEDREQFFNNFWKLGNLEGQRNFILNHMQSIQPKYRRVLIDRQKERGLNKAYYFNKNDERKQVCFLFFRSTLGISERFIRTVKCKDEGGFLAKDLRGKEKHAVVPEQIKNDMRNHLSSIPAMESHYTRANTQKKYIEGGKTVKDLYNDYVDLCEEQNKSYGKISMYRYLFNYEFNMSFHIPKKDQCLACNTYRNSNPDEKLELEESHQSHIAEKKLSRDEKSRDKSKISNVFHVTCFDLQAALPVPKGDVSSFYYKSRLNCYDFTICELQQQGLGPVDCFFLA